MTEDKPQWRERLDKAMVDGLEHDGPDGKCRASWIGEPCAYQIDWWNMQPWWFKRLRLFSTIVWRQYESRRMTVDVSWRVSCLMHPGPPR